MLGRTTNSGRSLVAIAKANRDLKEILKYLREAADELTLAGKGVRARTKSSSEEGVLAEEAIDLAHRVADLKEEPVADRQEARETGTGSVETGDPNASSHGAAAAQPATPLEVVLMHLDRASAALDHARRGMSGHLDATGEEGCLAEEVIDLAHRVGDRKDRRQREKLTQTGDFFESKSDVQSRQGLLDLLLGG